MTPLALALDDDDAALPKLSQSEEQGQEPPPPAPPHPLSPPSPSSPPSTRARARATPLDLLSTPRPFPLPTPSLRLDEQQQGWPSQDARSGREGGDEGEVDGGGESTPRPAAAFEQQYERPAPTRTFVSFDSLLVASLSSSSEGDEGELFLERERPRTRSARSARAVQQEEEDDGGPPSPVALPGGWMGGKQWRRRRGGGGGKGKGRAEEDEGETTEEEEEEDDAALLLPPPFLADDSAAESFDGLLGSRAHRLARRLHAHHERLHSLGRGPPAPFPQSLVKGAWKVVRLLGPPGGFDARAGKGGGAGSRSKREEEEVIERAFGAEDSDAAEERRERRDDETRRRRVRRAESGVRAYEVAVGVGRKVAGRLERHRSGRGGGFLAFGSRDVGEEEEEGGEEGRGEDDGTEVRERRMRAATPSDLLGSPPEHSLSPFPPSSFLPSPSSVNDVPSSPTLTPLDALHALPADLLPLPTPSSSGTLLEPLLVPTPGAGARSDFRARAPLPTVQTPFALDPTDDFGGGEGYFGLRRRGSARRRRKDSSASASNGGGATAPTPSPSRPTFSLPHIPPGAPPSWHHRLLDLLVYLLIGAAPSAPPTASLEALDTSLASLGGLLGLLIHLVGFAFFLVYHFSALLVSSYFALKSAGVWAYWAGRNLTGRTEVSRSVRGYWRTCRGEWDRVCEERGERRLGAVRVARALLELAALQSMTRYRFLYSGPGNLRLLTAPTTAPSSPSALPPSTPRFGPSHPRRRPSLPRLNLSLGLGLDRPAFTQRASSYRWTGGGDEQDGEGLVVEKQDGGVLEGSLISHEWEEEKRRAVKAAGAGGEKVRRDGLRVVTPKVAPASFGQVVDGADVTETPGAMDDLPPLSLDGDASPLPFSPSSPPLFPLPEHPTTPLLSLLTTLKRHCRLATASYGLHVYLVDAPTPLLTPSGKTLPHRVFAHLGGMSDHRNVLHVALQKRYEDGGGAGGRAVEGKGKERSREEEEAMPYAPQFYLLRDDANGEIVCVIRGTQSLADVRTDLDGDFVDLPLPGPHPPSSSPSPSPPTYRIHSSILSTARHLLSPPSSSSSSTSASTTPRSPLFDKLRQILHDHPRYALTFTGHSLGAALASTLAVLLGAYDDKAGEWYVDPGAELARRAAGEGGEAFRRPLRAVCFAHPTTVCANLAARCALPSVTRPSPAAGSAKIEQEDEADEEGTPLVVNVSLGADVICRMGIPHVRELRRAVGRLDRLRGRPSREDGGDAKEGREGVLGLWWRWRKVAGRAEEGDEGAAREMAELEERAWTLRRKVEAWEAVEAGGDARETAVPAGKCYHLDRLPPALEAQRRAELRAEGEADEDEDDEPLFGLWEVRDSRFYRLPQLEGDLVAAHMPKAYLDAVDALTL
ncbi:hypothetical protein JCM6882_009013 [Rhodosporidiobolus microsporus]